MFFPFSCIRFTECPSSGNILSSLSESDNSIQVTGHAQVQHVKDKYTQQVSKTKFLGKYKGGPKNIQNYFFKMVY